jgi:hypothetical protein
MANDWKIKSIEGGGTGQLLDGLQIRRNAADTGYELVQVLATSECDELPIPFPPFIYKDLIWNLQIDTFEFGKERNEAHGPWRNNVSPSGAPAEEDGTYTAQSGAGASEDDKGDAASASA